MLEIDCSYFVLMHKIQVHLNKRLQILEQNLQIEKENMYTFKTILHLLDISFMVC